MRGRGIAVVLALGLAACAPRPPRVAVGALAAGLDEFVAAHALAGGARASAPTRWAAA